MRVVGILLALLSVAATAAGDPPSPPGPGPAPGRPAEAAAAVLGAVRGNDAAALEGLAAQDAPDPWIVVEMLLRRGETAAAEAFAKASPRARTRGLPAYVAAHRDDPLDSPARLAYERGLEAYRARDIEGALRIYEQGARASGPDVMTVSLHRNRALILRDAGRSDEAVAAFVAAADGAEAIGWHARASQCIAEAARLRRGGDQTRERIALLERGVRIDESLGDGVAAAAGLEVLAALWSRLGENAKGIEAGRRAARHYEAAGDRRPLGSLWGLVAGMHWGLRQRDEALAAVERALALHREHAQEDELVEAHLLASAIRHEMGLLRDALADAEAGWEIAQRRGDQGAADRLLQLAGTLHGLLGDGLRAIEFHRRVLAAAEERDAKADMAQALLLLGARQQSLGEVRDARDSFQRALGLYEALRDVRGQAHALGSLALAQTGLGRLSESIRSCERALALLGDGAKPFDRGTAALQMGATLRRLGDAAGAVPWFRRAAEAFRDSAPNAATALGALGEAHGALQQHAEAAEALSLALVEFERMHARVGLAAARAARAWVRLESGDARAALADADVAWKLATEIGAPDLAAGASGILGTAWRTLGEPEQALALHRRALEEAIDSGDQPVEASALGDLARSLLAAGDAQGSIEYARRAAERGSSLSAGLSEELGASWRAGQMEGYDAGIAAALRLGDVDAVVRFLEQGRARVLLESLQARDAIRMAGLPPDLVTAEAAARSEQVAAAHAMRDARKSGDRMLVRAARRRLDAADEAGRLVVGRIQREAKAVAALVHPEPDDAAQLRGRLPEGSALVLYSLGAEEAAAAVLTRADTRVVDLGPTGAIREALEGLDPARPDVDPSPAVARVRRLLLAPLGLEASVRRLLVSPDGAIAYVPFALLDPRLEIAYEPSGTTLGVLAAEGALRGHGVLALGDPDYEAGGDSSGLRSVVRGEPLARLPATAEEARAVGDLVLLREQATETRLAAALATRERWRAVHLACHGRIDAERPMLSSLALTMSREDDGQWTALDVFRSHVPADLVALSACETAKGRLVRGEGIVGLTRAFMFAGAPRVLCSLWRVDDEATRALMIRFYELWNPRDGSPGVPAAAALRMAQEHVRTHDREVVDQEASRREGREIRRRERRWEHPHYWAAWVLWGLPD